MVDAQLTAESQMTFEYKLSGAVSAVCVRDIATQHMLIIKPRTHGNGKTAKEMVWFVCA